MKHMIFYAATEAELFDFAITETSLNDIRDTGFDSVYLEYRNTRADKASPRFQTWLTRFCQAASGRNLAVAMDVHLNSIRKDLEDHHPEIFTDPLDIQVQRLETDLFTLDLAGEPLHWQVERVYGIERMNSGILKSAEEITPKLKRVSIVSEGGGCAMTEARGPAISRHTFSLTGYAGKEILLILRKRFTYGFPDLGHPVLADQLPMLMERMASPDRPVAGYMWDEPHFGFAFFPNNGRAVSDRLYDRFQERFGYDLRERLVELWWDVAGQDSCMVRLHYAELLEGELASLEERFVQETSRIHDRYADSPFPFLGMHRTMHEELGDDFFIGCSDYFRHNRFTSNGFTDSVFERDDSMLTFFRLAQSLGLASRDGEAWSNTWGFRPTVAHHQYYFPLMGMMRLRWIGHTYHDSMQFGPGYPHHPLWKTLPGHLEDHRRLFDMLEGTQPAADTAVVYNWKAMARYPDAGLHTHRRNLLLLSKQLMQQGTQFLFISDDMLAEATIQNRELHTTIGPFRRLIVPWADLLTPGAFDSLEELAAAGVEIILFGAPAEHTSDGADVRERFSALLQAEVGPAFLSNEKSTLTLKGQPVRFDPESVQPNFRSNPVATYPGSTRIYPLIPGTSPEGLAQMDGTCIGLKNGTTHYFGWDLPLCPGAVSSICPGWEGSLPEGVIPILSRSEDSEFLGVCGEFGTPMTGEIQWNGQHLHLDQHRFLLWEHRSGVINCLVASGQTDSSS
jgi:hypothetical protein